MKNGHRSHFSSLSNWKEEACDDHSFTFTKSDYLSYHDTGVVEVILEPAQTTEACFDAQNFSSSIRIECCFCCFWRVFGRLKQGRIWYGLIKNIFVFTNRHTKLHSFQNTSLEFIPRGGGGGTPYNGLYGEAPPERGTFFTLQVYFTS